MKNIGRLLRLAKPYRLYLIIAGISLLSITLLNLLGPWLIRDLLATLGMDRQPDTLRHIIILAGAFLATVLGKALFRFLNNYLSHKAAWNLVADVRVLVYEHLQKLSLRYYHDKQTGQLMSRATNDTATFESLIAHVVPDMAANILILIGVTSILFFLDPLLAVLTFIPVPFLVWGGFLFSRKIQPNFKAAQSTLADLNSTLQDNISGMKEIQVFNRQADEKARVQGRARTYAAAILRALKLSAIFHPAVEAFGSLGTVIVVGFGGYLALEGRLAVPDIVGFLLYLNLFYQPIASLARVTEDLQMALAGADRVFEVLDTESDVADSPGAVAVPRGAGEVVFDRVSFSYLPTAPVLQDVSFRAAPGEMIALVGPTGVGKTTIISLIARFYDTNSGSILLDGRDIRTMTLASLRDQVSIVLQDIFLFNGTVAENIAYGSRNATEADILNASRIARAEDFILKMPEGFDTRIGERGVKLSGGQKQRLAIARAVLRDTPILIMDEATASVDVETEALIQQAIQELAGSRTIIVIAHRLSTVKRADRILVVKEGLIAESGTHEELLAAGGLYSTLCRAQFQQLDAPKRPRRKNPRTAEAAAAAQAAAAASAGAVSSDEDDSE